MKTLIALATILYLIASCSGETKTQEQIKSEIQEFIAEKNYPMTESPSGVFYEIIEDGSGYPIHYNDKILVTYRGEFLDGKVFDERKEEIEFNLKGLIPAWKEVLPGNNVGCIVRLIVPPHMGYGDQDRGDIPANSTLHFVIRVHDAY